jgi:hypothetical protein
MKNPEGRSGHMKRPEWYSAGLGRAGNMRMFVAFCGSCLSLSNVPPYGPGDEVTAVSLACDLSREPFIV